MNDLSPPQDLAAESAVPRRTIPHLTDSYQNQQDNRLTFVKIGRADLCMPRSDFGRTPSPVQPS